MIDGEYNLVGLEFLVHLRYLCVRKVPKSLHKIVNLEYLMAYGGNKMDRHVLYVM